MVYSHAKDAERSDAGLLGEYCEGEQPARRSGCEESASVSVWRIAFRGIGMVEREPPFKLDSLDQPFP